MTLVSTGVFADEAQLTRLTEQLAAHPKVTQLLAKREYFEHMAHTAEGLPNPQVILGIDNLPINDPAFDRFLPTSKVLGVRQQFPSSELRDSRAKENRVLADKQQLMAKYQTERLRALLQNQLVSLQEIAALEKQQLRKQRLFAVMETELKGQLSAGVAVYSELHDVDIRRSQVKVTLNQLQGKRQNIEADMQSLLGEVVSIPLEDITPKSWQNETALYPILIAEQDIVLSNQKLASADAQYAPDFALQALYKQRESGDNFSGDDWLSVQASISLPLWSAARLSANKRATLAQSQQVQDELEDIRRDTLRHLAQLQTDYDTLASTLALLKKRKSPLQQSINALQNRYQAGDISQQRVLKGELDLIELNSDIITTNANLQRTAANINSFIAGGENADTH